MSDPIRVDFKRRRRRRSRSSSSAKYAAYTPVRARAPASHAAINWRAVPRFLVFFLGFVALMAILKVMIPG